MFKLIVLAAFMALAAAAPAPAPAPGVVGAPVLSTYSAPYVAPALSYHAPLAYKTLPLTYAAPYAAPYAASYAAPYAAPYHYGSPLAYKAVTYL